MEPVEADEDLAGPTGSVPVSALSPFEHISNPDMDVEERNVGVDDGIADTTSILRELSVDNERRSTSVTSTRSMGFHDSSRSAGSSRPQPSLDVKPNIGVKANLRTPRSAVHYGESDDEDEKQDEEDDDGDEDEDEEEYQDENDEGGGEGDEQEEGAGQASKNNNNNNNNNDDYDDEEEEAKYHHDEDVPNSVGVLTGPEIIHALEAKDREAVKRFKAGMSYPDAPPKTEIPPPGIQSSPAQYLSDIQADGAVTDQGKEELAKIVDGLSTSEKNKKAICFWKGCPIDDHRKSHVVLQQMQKASTWEAYKFKSVLVGRDSHKAAYAKSMVPFTGLGISNESSNTVYGMHCVLHPQSRIILL